MRPTGPLHVGHLAGALPNWVDLQSKYECYFMVADWHALTSAYDDPSTIRTWSLENVACWLAAGVDPATSVIFRQSDVPEHAELHLLLSMITPVPWLERVPTYKEMQQELATKDLATYGFLGYPVLQTADVIAYKATHVPVGEDQVAHLELGREIVRRFNHLYGETLPEFQPILTRTPRLPGPDRRKMSKSYGNSIDLGGGRAQMEKQVMAMFTDPKKIRLGDKGDPAECVVFSYHKGFNEHAVDEVERGCRAGTLGCVACKKSLMDPFWSRLGPVHEAREKLLADRAGLESILAEGARKARVVAAATLAEVRKAMKLTA